MHRFGKVETEDGAAFDLEELGGSLSPGPKVTSGRKVVRNVVAVAVSATVFAGGFMGFGMGYFDLELGGDYATSARRFLAAAGKAAAAKETWQGPFTFGHFTDDFEVFNLYCDDCGIWKSVCPVAAAKKSVCPVAAAKDAEPEPEMQAGGVAVRKVF